MSHHFTQNTESITRWCGQCGKMTQHSVSGGRVGLCMEHDAPLYSKAQLRRREIQERDRQAPRLFE